MIVNIADLHSMSLELIEETRKEITVKNDGSFGSVCGDELTIRAIWPDEHDFGNGTEDVTIIELVDETHAHLLIH